MSEFNKRKHLFSILSCVEAPTVAFNITHTFVAETAAKGKRGPFLPIEVRLQ